MKEVDADSNLVAYCGLYCGACRAYMSGKCPGCHANQKAAWCKIRACCTEQGFATCAQCDSFPNPNDCAKFNNLIAKLFGLVFQSDRAACIQQIRTLGLEGHAEAMAKAKRQTIPR